jgi:hypothetical protein
MLRGRLAKLPPSSASCQSGRGTIL